MDQVRSPVLSAHKYVVIFEHEEDGLECEEVMGVFNELESAKSLVQELKVDLAVGQQHFSIEQWTGRRFGGTYDYTGKLIEKSDGSEVSQS